MWSFVQRLLGQPTEHRPKPSLSALDNSTFDRTKCVVHEVPEEFCHQDYNSDRRQVAMVIDNILSQEECARWIAETEARGYEQALLNVGGGQQILVTEVRKSLRCTVTDFDRVAELWQRVQPFLPEPLVFRDEYIPRELNELLRFLRYDPGDYFRPHMDGSFVHPADHPHADDRSFMTMFLYLNEGYEGGHTSLFATNENGKVFDVVPKTGSVFLFEHRMLHCGDTLLRGRKYAVRTDIMCTKKPRVDLAPDHNDDGSTNDDTHTVPATAVAEDPHSTPDRTT